MGSQNSSQKATVKRAGVKVEAFFRMTGPESFSVSFTRDDSGGFLAGDVLDVATEGGTRITAQVLSATMMGRIQVCNLKAIQISGTPLGGGQERRKTERIRLPAGSTVIIRARGRSGNGLTARMADVSTGGCRVEVPDAGERRDFADKVDLEFTLGASSRLRGQADVINTFISKSGVLTMGCRWSAGAANRPIIDAIDSFVKNASAHRASAAG
ncbi:MAG: PilZ domain-containing protein [Actinomycetota bacterium]